jgi:excisionase family DNA binding protein
VSIATALLAELGDEDLAVLADRLRPFLDRVKTDRLLSPAEAGKRLGIHPKTLTRAAAAGRVPKAVRVGRAWRFQPDGLTLDPPATMRQQPLVQATRPRSTAASSAADAIRGAL